MGGEIHYPPAKKQRTKTTWDQIWSEDPEKRIRGTVCGMTSAGSSVYVAMSLLFARQTATRHLQATLSSTKKTAPLLSNVLLRTRLLTQQEPPVPREHLEESVPGSGLFNQERFETLNSQCVGGVFTVLQYLQSASDEAVAYRGTSSERDCPRSQNYEKTAPWPLP